MNSRKILQNFSLFLISVLVMVIILEIFLRVVDPLGIDAHMRSIRMLGAAMEPDPREYALAPGTYDFVTWSTTIDNQRYRVIPDETPSDCTIAVLGDSVAFGQGVDDDANWLNLLAPDIDAQLINAAMPGYNFPHIAQSYEHVAADGYIYLIVGNDADRTPPFQFVPDVVFNPVGSSFIDWIGWLQYNVRYEWLRATYVYSGVLYRNATTDGTYISPNDDYDAYLEVIDRLASADNTLLMAFEGDFLTERTQAHVPDEVITIPRWTQVISWMDSHPNAAGHRELADAAHEVISEFATSVCGDI